MAITNSSRQLDARRVAPDVAASSSSSFTKEASQRALHTSACGACCYCSDTCHDATCVDCEDKLTLSERSSSSGASSSDGLQSSSSSSYTMCEIARHNTADSCWLLVGDVIYDATSYMQQHQHPGGAASILKKSGGAVDCTMDFNFHSKNGKKTWQKYRVGKLQKCPGPHPQPDEKQWWKIFWG